MQKWLLPPKPGCTWWTSRTSCHAFSQIHPDINACYIYIYSSYVHLPNRYHYSVLGYRKEQRHFKQKTLLTFKKPSLVTLAQHISNTKHLQKKKHRKGMVIKFQELYQAGIQPVWCFSHAPIGLFFGGERWKWTGSRCFQVGWTLWFGARSP